jgi:dTDP-4-amino-4,6-dideoxygalactose transaminase
MKRIQMSAPSITDAEKEAVCRALDSGYLGSGPEVDLFEKELASFLELPAESVACVNSGTAALHLACQAIGLKKGDEVLVPSLTFLATFQAVGASGATPIPCDVNLETAFVCLDSLKENVCSKTKAIMPVHYASQLQGRSQAIEFAKKHNLRVIEDAAHSFGSLVNGVPLGGDADIVCFSFDPIKNITCGEGGAVVSRDQEFIRRIKRLRKLAIEIRDSKSMQVFEQGWRYHMSDIMASIGRVQLRRLKSELGPTRQSLVNRYWKRLAKESRISIITPDEPRIIPHIFVVRLPAEKRNIAQDTLASMGIECTIHYPPNHLFKLFNGSRKTLPNSEKLFSELLTLPLQPQMTGKDVDLICDVLLSIF